MVAKLNPSKFLRNPSAATFRRLANWFPPIRNSGVRITRISEDWTEWDLRLRLGIKTRNYVGTHFGGTLFSALDAHLMLAWMHILGLDYIVWDKGATIRFLRPGRTHLTCAIRIDPAEVESVRELCETQPKLDRTYTLAWLDADGAVVAECDKVLHFRKKT